MSNDEIRDHLEKERQAQERRGAWGKLRAAIDVCERFATPEDAMFLEESLVVEERRRRLDARIPQWPRVNKRFCRVWVYGWVSAVKWVRVLGIEGPLARLNPDDPVHCAMHKLLGQLLHGRSPRLVADDLAELRRSCEADYLDLAPDVTRPRLVIRGRRFELSKYFLWLRDETQRIRAVEAVAEHRAGRTAPRLPGAEGVPVGQPGPPDDGTSWADRVLALIFGRGRTWSVKELAEAVGMARSTLYRNARVGAALKARRASGGAIAEGEMDGERRHFSK
mgnify:CR=1 FL=1